MAGTPRLQAQTPPELSDSGRAGARRGSSGAVGQGERRTKGSWPGGWALGPEDGQGAAGWREVGWAESPLGGARATAGWKCPLEQVIRPNKQTERGQGSCLSTQAEFCDLFCDLAPDNVLWSMRKVVADFSVSPRAGFKLVAEA